LAIIGEIGNCASETNSLLAVIEKTMGGTKIIFQLVINQSTYMVLLQREEDSAPVILGGNDFCGFVIMRTIFPWEDHHHLSPLVQ